MSSTYSELKFELMGTGEQAGTWGAKTNTNLGTAINEAIANLAPVDTGNTDYTFTWTNTNATQAARHFGLNLYTTGSHSAPYDVTVPTIQKPYMVNNSSGAVATVKISGGSGVAVPNNKTTMVYANGSNVVPMFDWMPALTLGTLAVTTAIPLSRQNAVSRRYWANGVGVAVLRPHRHIKLSPFFGNERRTFWHSIAIRKPVNKFDKVFHAYVYQKKD